MIQSTAKDSVKTAGLDAVKQLQAKKADRSIAGKLGVAWKDVVVIDRKTNSVNSVVVKQAFRMTKPAENAINYDGVELPNGDYSIISLSKVAEGDPATIDKASREKIKGQLVNERMGNSQDNLLATLRSNARINVQEDEL